MISYRTRQSLRRFFTGLVITAVILAVVGMVWLLWLNRYVIYTRDGAKLDFSLDLQFPAGEVAQRPTETGGVDIYYNEGSDAVLPETTELQQLTGYMITAEMLQGNIPALSKQLQKLPSGTPILLDVKNIRGDFFYNTNLGPGSSKVDAAALETMITTLNSKGYYLIARLPAFRDYWYGRENVNDGLFNLDRYSLWLDPDRCYWLNPTSEGTMTYLVQIISQLRSLGFDEVVFYDFQFPDTNKIYFKEDKAEAIREAAKTLVRTCSTDTFAVSFVSSDPSFPLPQGRSRLYFSGVSAADAASLVSQSGLADPDVRIVFLTDLMDTRFDDYGVLRPFHPET